MCQHQFLDLPQFCGRMEKLGVVRFWFYCKFCLELVSKDVKDNQFEWTEKEPWRGDPV